MDWVLVTMSAIISFSLGLVILFDIIERLRRSRERKNEPPIEHHPRGPYL